MADDAEQVGADEVADAASAAPEASEAAAADPQQPAAGENPGHEATAAPATGKDATVSPEDIELLMNKAEQALASIDESGEQTPGVLAGGLRRFDFEQFGGAPANTEKATLELMRDVQLDMTIELGRTQMQLEDVLKLKQGAVVPLDKLAGDPADIYVNGRLVARGEVLVLNDNFCVRVAELIVGDEATE